MERYAKIESGVVVNVTKLDPNDIPTGFQNWVSCGNAGPGWRYDGATFSEPLPAPPDDALVSAEVRKKRDALLVTSDRVVTKAVEKNAIDGLGVEILEVWIDYRQALRDIPQQTGFPHSVTWPQEP